MKVVRGNEISLIPASHEDSQSPGVLKKILATRQDFVSGRVQMLNWSICPKGSSFRKHFHEDMQEVFVIINGAVQMQVDDESIDLTAGDAILIDALAVHQMTNVCNEDVQYIVFGISAGNDGKTVVVENG